jgi:hypothetical protein
LAQKSLSILHRVDTSMIWTSFFHEKRYKWLSFNLWFFYIFFYKNFFFFNLKKLNINYFKDYNYFLNFKKINKTIKKNSVRFSYHINLYCIETLNYLILLNLYFKTNLAFYRKKNITQDNNKINLNNFFYN